MRYDYGVHLHLKDEFKAFTISRFPDGMVGIDEICFVKYPRVEAHPALNPLWEAMAKKAVSRPLWINKKPENAWKPFSKWGARAFLYIVLKCSHANGPYFVERLEAFDTYRRDFNMRWRLALDERKLIQGRT